MATRKRKKSKRTRFYVIPAKGPDGGWDVKKGKRKIAWSPVKAGAVAHGVNEARGMYERSGRLTRLIIYGANGRIMSERTYGEDPRRYRG